MPDAKPVFPQIPSTVWWGIRDQFKKSIPPKVSDTYLVAQLNVQATAAKAYLAELKRVGILDEEGKPTEAAKNWRFDDNYREAADQILRTAYPAELIDVAPPTDSDRSKAVRWFMRAGDLGEGAARNKAATYFMIGALEPPSDTPTSKGSKKTPKTDSGTSMSAKAPRADKEKDPPKRQQPPQNEGGETIMPLNVNIQIHISADASSDQIEAIFSNMKKYLKS